MADWWESRERFLGLESLFGHQEIGSQSLFSQSIRPGQWISSGTSTLNLRDLIQGPPPRPRLPDMPFNGADRVQVTLDNEYRVHSFNGKAAVVFPDGREEFYWHGVKVPGFVITNPEKITVLDIQSEGNTEVRRVMLEKYGLSNYLKNAGARLLDEDEFGKLWRVEIAGDEPLVMVEVLNSTPEPDGTTKTYFLRVPPDMLTPQQAIAWTFNLEAHEYDPVFMS